jgi:PAS domain S-box-containing protein
MPEGAVAMESVHSLAEQALLNEARLEALLKLSQMTEAPLQEISDFSLEQAVLLTKSRIGYLAFVNEAETVLTMHSWSKSAMKECAIADKPLIYSVETTGLWGEAVRQRKPIVTNDYAAPNPWKKGLPEGHVDLSRHMNVPIFDGGHIVIVAGVADKEAEYDESDVRQLTLLMEGMWTLLQRQRVQVELRRHRDHLEQLVQERTAEVLRANEDLRLSEEKYRTLVQTSPEALVQTDLKGTVTFVSRQTLKLHGSESAEDLVGRHALAFIALEDHSRFATNFQTTLDKGVTRDIEYTFVRKDGTCFPGEATAAVVQDVSGKPMAVVALVRDITERKQVAMALQESETKLKTVFEILPVGISILDTNRRIVDANPALETILGMSREGLLKSEYRRRQYLRRDGSLMPPEEFPSVRAIVKGTAVTDVEVAVVKEDGATVWTSVSAAPLPVPGLSAAVITTDITARKLVENSLRQTRDKLQAIYDGMPDGLVIVDRQTMQIIRANAAICRMVGYSEAELLSMSVKRLHPVEQLPTTAGAARAEAEGRFHIHEDVPVLRKDGGIFYADIANNYVDYRGRRCVICFFRDITERKQAGEALRASEERFRSYFTQGLIGMAVTSSTMEWQEVNDRLCEILGYSRQELLGMKWTDTTHPDDLQSGIERFSRMAAGENDHYTYDKRFIHKDGSIVHATLFVRCFRREDGTVDHVLALIEDTTAREQAEAALQREHQTLKHLLQSSDHERQIIAYEIHDGLAQYLAGAMMQFEVYNHLKETRPKEAARAYNAGITLLRQGHLDARRLISGVRPLTLDEEGVTAAISDLVNERQRSGGPKIEFHKDVKFDRLVPILENAIYRIAQEGLANACSHSKSERIRVELVQRGNMVRLVVQDWGTGFDPSEVEGNRFGLPGMRERARLLGGTIDLKSTPGEGTCITVELPLAMGA